MSRLMLYYIVENCRATRNSLHSVIQLFNYSTPQQNIVRASNIVVITHAFISNHSLIWKAGVFLSALPSQRNQEEMRKNCLYGDAKIIN